MHGHSAECDLDRQPADHPATAGGLASGMKAWLGPRLEYRVQGRRLIEEYVDRKLALALTTHNLSLVNVLDGSIEPARSVSQA